MEFTEEALKAELRKIKPEDGKDIVDKMVTAIYTWLKAATVTVTVPVIPVQVAVPAGTGSTTTTVTATGKLQ